MIVPDLLDYDFGFSRSSDDVAHRHAALQEHVASLGDLISQLGVRVDLVGHSYGGCVSTFLAQVRPLLLHKLILMCPYGAGLHSYANEIATELNFSRVLQQQGSARLVSRAVGGFFLNAQDLAVSSSVPHFASNCRQAIQVSTMLIWGTADALCQPLPSPQLFARFAHHPEAFWICGGNHWLTIDSVLSLSRLLCRPVGQVGVTGTIDLPPATSAAHAALRLLLRPTDRPIELMKSTPHATPADSTQVGPNARL